MLHLRAPHSTLALRSLVRVQAQARSGTPESLPDPYDRHREARQPLVPDALDRHSSARDRQMANSKHLRANVKKTTFNTANRRRGRPAHLRSPDDSPLRDGNRDRLIGLLTERAARTLLVYLQELNPSMYQWLFLYLKEHPIPLSGNWDEVSGEVFLRTMMSKPEETARVGHVTQELFRNATTIGVEPRALAQRIMDIRVQLSREFIQELTCVEQENSLLLRETLHASLQNALQMEPMKDEELPPLQRKVFIHPELLGEDGSLHPDIAVSHPELISAVARQSPPRSPSPSPSPSPNPSPNPAPPHPTAPSAASTSPTASPPSPPATKPSSSSRGGAAPPAPPSASKPPSAAANMLVPAGLADTSGSPGAAQLPHPLQTLAPGDLAPQQQQPSGAGGPGPAPRLPQPAALAAPGPAASVVPHQAPTHPPSHPPACVDILGDGSAEGCPTPDHPPGPPAGQAQAVSSLDPHSAPGLLRPPGQGSRQGPQAGPGAGPARPGSSPRPQAPTPPGDSA
ncbi:hypothetical protein V8C86DRAFT_3133300 [Haematococcus lacustris]